MIETGEKLLCSALEYSSNALGLLLATAGAIFVLTIVYATSQEPVSAYVYAMALASLSTAMPLIRSVLEYWGSVKRCEKATDICYNMTPDDASMGYFMPAPESEITDSLLNFETDVAGLKVFTYRDQRAMHIVISARHAS
jgi:hypothetical protein